MFIELFEKMKLVRLNEAVNIDTPEFKRWFGNSKVVDDSGNPLVVYHGTKKSFGEFSASRYNDGFYFTPDAEVAGKYAMNRQHQGASMLPVYLSLQNPLNVTEEFLTEFYSKRGYEDEKALADVVEDYYFSIAIQREQVDNYAKDNGHDGLIIPHDLVEDRAIISYVVWKSNQIKSIYNKGAFNPASNDILEKKNV